MTLERIDQFTYSAFLNNWEAKWKMLKGVDVTEVLSVCDLESVIVELAPFLILNLIVGTVKVKRQGIGGVSDSVNCENDGSGVIESVVHTILKRRLRMSHTCVVEMYLKSSA